MSTSYIKSFEDKEMPTAVLPDVVMLDQLTNFRNNYSVKS